MSDEIMDINSEDFGTRKIISKLEDFQYSIEQAFECIDKVLDIRTILTNSKNTISTEAIQLARLSLVDIYETTGYSSINNSYSLEDNREYELSYVLEGLGNWLKSIWDAVCNALSKMWEWIKSIFSSNKATSAKQDAQITHLGEELKNTPKTENYNVGLEFQAITNPLLLTEFAWIENDITVDDCIENLNKLRESQVVLTKVTHNTLELVQYYTHNVKTEIITSDEETLNKINIIINRHHENNYDFIKNHVPTENTHINRMLLNSVSKDPNNRAVSSFTRGGGIIFANVKSDDISKYNIIVKSSTELQPKEKIDYFQKSDTQSLLVELRDYKKSYDVFEKELISTVDKINAGYKTFDKTVNEMLHKLNGNKSVDEYENVRAENKNKADVARLLKGFMHDIVQTIVPMVRVSRSYSQTINSYINLVQFNVQYYKHPNF